MSVTGTYSRKKVQEKIKEDIEKEQEQKTAETPKLSPTYSRTQAQQAIATGGKVETHETVAEPPLIPEGYTLVGAKVTGEKIELTLQKTTETPVSSGQAPTPTHVTDSVSQKLFKDITETQKMQRDPLGYTVTKTIEIGALATGLGAPAVAAKGAVVGLGVTQSIVGVTQQRLLTVEETKEAVLGGAAFSGAGTALFNVTGINALTGVKGAAVRTGASSLLGGGIGYVVTGGKPEGAVFGAAFGAGMSIGGEALSYAYPRYIKPAALKAYEKVANVLSPERALYQRVVLSQQVEAQSPKVSAVDKLVAKFSGEKAAEIKAFKHVVPKTPKPSESSLTGGFKTVGYGGGKGGGAKQWVVQQTLVKQTTAQKAATYPMKPILPTLTVNTATLKALTLTRTSVPTAKTVTKTKTKQVQRATSVVMGTPVTTRQVQNPFLRYQGKPYFRQRGRETEELVYLSYPKGSPLATPQEITRLSEITTPKYAQSPFTTSVPKSLQTPATTPIVSPALTPVSAVTPKEAVKETQIERQVQEMAQTVTQKQKQKTKTPFPQFPLGGGGAGTRSFDRMTGKWIPRKHKVKTPTQMLKTFGLGKATGKASKSIARMSKMEVPSFGKLKMPKVTLGGSTKRRKRRRSKR